MSNKRKAAALMALLLTVTVLAIGAVSAQRKVETFQPLGFSSQAEAGHWLVTSVAVRETGLQAGDQILLINGEGFGRTEDLGQVLRQRASSELQVVRGETLHAVDFHLPPLEIDFSYLILALIACGYVFIGLYTFTRHKERPALLFYFWCLASTAVYLIAAEPPFDSGMARLAYVVEAVARILLAPLTLHLFSIFPRRDATESRLRRWIPFYYLPAAFLLLLQADLINFDGRLLLRGKLAAAVPILDRLELYHLVLFSLGAAAVLGWRLYRPRAHEPHRQATWVALGMAAGYLPFLFLYLLPRELGTSLPQLLTASAVLPLALVPLTFAYAILRYKLWDIGVVVRDTLSLGVTIAIGAIGFSLANLAVSRIVPEDLPLGRNLLVFASGVMIAGLMIPTRRGVSNSLERVQYRGAYGRRRALTEFGRQIMEESDLERLSIRVADELRASLGITPVAILRLKGRSLVPAHRGHPDSAHREGLLEPFLSADEFPPAFWDAELNSFEAVEFPASTLSTAHKLHAAGYRYGFPLKVRANSLGVVVTGNKDGGVPLSSDDVDLLRGLFNQVALAIENAQLLGQVKRQLDEVSRLQRFTEQIIESSPAGIAVLDNDERIFSANAALGRLLEESPAELAGRRLRDYLPSEPLPKPGEGLREVSLPNQDGSKRYLQLSVAPLPTNEPGGHRVIVVQDVTERVAMENALKEKDRLASLGMLAAGVAHEVT
ncbi:MAG: PAS domain-containing protein, partial [Acidobacteriota bacterium]|nr:PAS domain-containing protein [Acidobacteriota bacterium]